MRWRPRAALLVLALALAVLTGCERGVELEPLRPSAAAASLDAAQAGRLVAQLQGALQQRDGDALARLGTPEAASLLAAVADNVVALDVRDVTVRYLAEDAPPAPGEQEALGDDVVAVRVRLGFAYGGIDRRPAELESRLLLVPGPDGPLLAGLGGVSTGTPQDQEAVELGRGTRTPLWLSSPLTVVRDGRTLLAVAGGGAQDGAEDGAGRYPALVETARKQVREVLTSWRGPLVVEVPADRAQLDAVLAAPDGRYDNIAGVATTVDGSAEPGSPVRVYLNPPVFGALGRQGAQVVLTHEATHVAVGAPYADMPVWLLEGFADYVALAGDRVPVDVAARQVLERVRADGLPDGLPTQADLAPSASGLGATYEEAWLAARYLADEFGQDALVRFYETVDDGTPPGQAFRGVLGTSQADFVAGWRRDVARLAGVAG